MDLKNQIRPYYVCGGFPKDDAWIFFVSSGQIKINGCNRMMEILLPLCNGCNYLDFVVEKLREEFTKGDIEDLFSKLFQYLILVDSNRIFQVFYAYSKNPMPFSKSLSQEETYSFTNDKSHLAPITGDCFEARFEKTSTQKVMDLRCSTREFSEEAVSEDMVFSLVWTAYGQQTKRANGESDFLERTFTVPSGGALYPLAIYVILFKQCDSLIRGIYLWHKEENLLELVREGDFLPEAEGIINGILSLRDAVGVICVVANFERSAKKYGNKAYNLIQQEVGHVMQNVALFCAEKNLGVVEIGGYKDEDLANILNLKFPDEAPLIVSAFGNKRRKL